MFGVGRGSSRPSSMRLDPGRFIIRGTQRQDETFIPAPASSPLVGERRGQHSKLEVKNGSSAGFGRPTLQWKREHTARCRGYLLVSRLPGFGYATLLALIESPFFSDHPVCGAGCGFAPQCAMCSLRRRAAVKGRMNWCVGESRGTAGGRLGYGRCLRSAGCAPIA